jgi:hypothetical protein
VDAEKSASGSRADPCTNKFHPELMFDFAFFNFGRKVDGKRLLNCKTEILTNRIFEFAIARLMKIFSIYAIMIAMEHITFETDTYLGAMPDAWVCVCGNTPVGQGFFPCDKGGNDVEPAIDSGWTDLYCCDSCGRVIKQSTLEVVGRNRHPKYLD